MHHSIERLEVPYIPDSAEIFQLLSEESWPIWLDSGNGFAGHHIDILAVNPLRKIGFTSTNAGFSTNTGFSTTGIELADSLPSLFQIIDETIEQHKHNTKHGPGWLGYLSYDLFDEFEALDKRKKQDLLPGATLGFYGYMVVNDHATKCTYILSLQTCLKQSAALQQRLSKHFNTPNNLPTPNDTFRLLDRFRPTTKKNEYEQQFEKVKRYIQNGDCYQVNLTQQFTSQCRGNGLKAFLALRQQHTSPMSAYFKTHDFEIISLSPERFIKTQGADIASFPIKGTRPRSADPQADNALKQELQASQKDRAENVMIVDLLRNDLGRVCETGSIKTSKLFKIESFPNVHHLVSTIEGQLRNDVTLFELFKATFPGGSITGAPKVRAMEIIEELEHHRRAIYCGSIVSFCANGDIDSNIAIRTFLKKSDQIFCWGGGGIVADSICNKEYQETLDKVGKLMNILESLFYEKP